MADSNGLESFLRPGEVDTMHEPVTLRCQWPQPSITRRFSPHSGRAELPASTVRAHAHLRNHLRHHEPRSQPSRANGTQQCSFRTCFSRLDAVSVQSRWRQPQPPLPASPRSSLLLGRARPRPLSSVIRPVLVFSVSQGDVFVVFRFVWVCCQERKKDAMMRERYRTKSEEPRS